MPITTTGNITNLQEKVIGPARLTLKDDALAIKRHFQVVPGRPGMDDTYNSPKLPGVTAFGLTEGVDMSTETIVDSNVAISATEVGVSVQITNKNLRTINRDEFLRQIGQAIGSAINVKQEQDFAALIDGFGTVVGLDGAAAVIGSLSAGLSQLRNASEPITEDKMRDVAAVISPYAWHAISQQLFPTGSGTSHAPDVAQNNRANADVLSQYWPVGNYFGTPIEISTNLVASSNDIRNGIFYKKAAIIYEFMPFDLVTDDSDKSMRAIELDGVIDYGYGEILDAHGREWDTDNTAVTS